MNTHDGQCVPPNDQCTICKGACCRRYACAAYPSDFPEPLQESLRAALSSGKWAVDTWEGDPRENMLELDEAYFIRPAHKGCTDLLDRPYRGECVFLTESGCELPYDKRPLGGRLLKPRSTLDDHCTMPESILSAKQDAAVAWLPYTELIRKLLEELCGIENC